MALSHVDVQHLARLARLSLTEAEVEQLSTQLSGILDHFTALAAVDTTGVEPTSNPLPLSNVMRPDEVDSSLPRTEVLANAPLDEEGMFKVRAVLE
ncbi:MAG TPA: Asp-tRNA(Asn)/Glu-tRNA(Gln) amidotransferase subunit GatC [Dehalococcoidia bacterium]|nr:Asp-tRNA(Asn)/Glu-tRNA(Gln) amidotransferase subunit GatC [Dehalococcoidia bacterium]